MIFRQLFDAESFTYTYLIADEVTCKAVLIDPVIDKIDDYLLLLKELSLQLDYALDTHTHADHISAAGPLRDRTQCLAMIGEPSSVHCVSKTFDNGALIPVGHLTITAIHTPGHTSDSYCFLLSDHGQDYLFSGDTLLIRGSGRTDFQQGDPQAQYDSIFNKLLTLPEDTRVYPGHDYRGWTVSTIREEKHNNPRLQVKNSEEYAEIMNNLNLPNPKMMDIAIPANMACGKILVPERPLR